jgi:hypothetical protein
LVEAADYIGPTDEPGVTKTFARLGRWEGPPDGPVAGFAIIAHTKRDTEAGPESD